MRHLNSGTCATMNAAICMSEEEKIKRIKNILNAFFVKRMNMSWGKRFE